jgi:cell cycle arrest protein BUB3
LLIELYFRLELTNASISNFGGHDDAIRSIVHNEPTGLIFTGSWDRTVAAWDDRSASAASDKPPVTSLALPDKVYSMDICDDRNLLLVATAGRHIYLYDTRALGQPLQKRESSLKYQTRTVRFFPPAPSEPGQQGGFICASIEGRVAVDFIDPSPQVQQARYAFKCHRQTQTPSSIDDAPMEIVYPVNAVACHPNPSKSVCFFTGGSDGIINSWDRLLRKRIRQFPKYSTGISALAIDSQGDFLASAISYSFDEGEKDHPPESIFIRKLEDVDIKSKSK